MLRAMKMLANAPKGFYCAHNIPHCSSSALAKEEVCPSEQQIAADGESRFFELIVLEFGPHFCNALVDE